MSKFLSPVCPNCKSPDNVYAASLEVTNMRGKGILLEWNGTRGLDCKEDGIPTAKISYECADCGEEWALISNFAVSRHAEVALPTEVPKILQAKGRRSTKNGKSL